METPDLQTLYGDHSVQTRANIGPAGSPLEDLIKRLLMARMAPRRTGGFGAAPARGSGSPSLAERRANSMGRISEEMAQLDLRERKNQVAAREQPPMRAMGWLGPTYFDPLGFNAYEREVYMPDDARIIQSPENQARAEMDLRDHERGEQDRRQNWEEYGSPGSGGDSGYGQGGDSTSALQQRIAQLEAALNGGK